MRYKARVVVNPRNKDEADVFRAAGIECPHALPLAGGRLCYAPPAAVDRPLEEDPVPAKPSGEDREEGQKGKKGRPKGSKNRKTLEREAPATAQGGAEQDGEVQSGSGEKRGPGRPKGSKNKKTLEREAELKAAHDAKYPPKRGRGRPKGSKNKKKEGVEESSPSG